MTEPLVGLPPIWTSFLSSLALILYGLLVEKHYVAYYSALMNVVFGAISLSSVLVPLNLYFFYVPYLVIGVLVLIKYFKNGFFMFSTKVFGSFSLALALYQLIPNGSINPLLRLAGTEIPADWNTASYILSVWILASIVFGIFGHILTAKTGLNELEEASDD